MPRLPHTLTSRTKGAQTEHVLTVNGTDGPVAQIVYTEDANDPARKLFLHQEALGSVGLVTDSIGGEVQRTYFDPFGAKVGADGAAVSPEMGDVKLGFTGHRHDDEAGVAALQAIATVAVTVAAVAGGPKRAGTGPTADAKGAPRIDPTKPANEVLPGSLRREFPGQHLNKSLNEIKEALRTTDGAEKRSLQTAKKILEQSARLLDKAKNK